MSAGKNPRASPSFLSKNSTTSLQFAIGQSRIVRSFREPSPSIGDSMILPRSTGKSNLPPSGTCVTKSSSAFGCSCLLIDSGPSPRLAPCLWRADLKLFTPYSCSVHTWCVLCHSLLAFPSSVPPMRFGRLAAGGQPSPSRLPFLFIGRRLTHGLVEYRRKFPSRSPYFGRGRQKGHTTLLGGRL